MLTKTSSISETYQSVAPSTTRNLKQEFPKVINWRDRLSRDVDNGANATLDQRRLFTTVDHDTPTYVWNTDFWLKGYEQAFTCRAPYSEEAGDNHRLTTAITPRHAVSAWHAGYTPDVGTKVRFVATDGTVIERTVVQRSDELTWYNPERVDSMRPTDVGVILLDSDLPDTITPCKLFPYNYTNVLHDIDQTRMGAASYSNDMDRVEKPLISIVACDQEHKTHPYVHITFLPEQTNYRKIWAKWRTMEEDSYDHKHTDVWWSDYTNDNIIKHPDATFIHHKPSWKRTWGRWFVKPEWPTDGDSGNPVFCAVNKELWLISSIFGARGGPFYSGLLPEIKTAIAALEAAEGINTGYTPTEGNLLDV